MTTGERVARYGEEVGGAGGRLEPHDGRLAGYDLVSTSVWPWQQNGGGQEQIIGSRCGRAPILRGRNSFHLISLGILELGYEEPHSAAAAVVGEGDQAGPGGPISEGGNAGVIQNKRDDMWLRHFQLPPILPEGAESRR